MFGTPDYMIHKYVEEAYKLYGGSQEFSKGNPKVKGNKRLRKKTKGRRRTIH